MTIEEALFRADEGTLGPISCKILAAEVRRLREAYSRQVDGTAELQTTLTRERDRYREALKRIVSGYDFTAPENMLYIARDALRGGEE